jgi:putative two-component system response regulator
MPEMDGFAVARAIRQSHPCGDVPIVMVTALTGIQERLCAVEAGANDFITKPINRAELRVRTDSLLAVKAAQDDIKRHRQALEEEVARRTGELERALAEAAEARREADAAHLDTIQRLAVAGEYRDAQTSDHIERVSHYCAILARALGLPDEEVAILRHSSAMHDVGKIGVSDTILLKPGPLTTEERATMQQHAAIGARILGGSGHPLLNAGEVIALTHHERWDGTGYPNGLSGEDIPLYGRICAVADVFDALISRRPYKDAISIDDALSIMRAERGAYFDPTILDLFFDNLEEILAVGRRAP